MHHPAGRRYRRRVHFATGVITAQGLCRRGYQSCTGIAAGWFAPPQRSADIVACEARKLATLSLWGGAASRADGYQRRQVCHAGQAQSSSMRGRNAPVCMTAAKPPEISDSCGAPISTLPEIPGGGVGRRDGESTGGHAGGSPKSDAATSRGRLRASWDLLPKLGSAPRENPRRASLGCPRVGTLWGTFGKCIRIALRT